MTVKALFCVSALLVQSVLSQYPGRIGQGIPGPYGAGPAFGFDGLAGPYGLGCGCGVASTGGGLPVTSASPFPPIGVTIVSENTYEGALTVGGSLPFLATVALEGVLPTVGSGTVSYGCGNGAVGIAVEEGPIATGIVPNAPGLPGVGYNGLGYGPAGFGGCGYGGMY